MKIFTAVFLFVVMLGCKIEVDAGSFNLSGSWDPGISFGRRLSQRQKYHARNNRDDGNSDWPQPSHINYFEVSNSSSDNIPYETGPNNNERPQAPHHGSHGRVRKH